MQRVCKRAINGVMDQAGSPGVSHRDSQGVTLEMRPQVGECLQDEEASVGRGDLLLFEPPGVLVGNEDGVEPGLQRRVDVGARRIADHPGARGVELALLDDRSVGLLRFLVDHSGR